MPNPQVLLGDAYPTAVFALKLVLSLWMVAVSWLDHRTGLISNRLTAPVMLGVAIYRLVSAFVDHSTITVFVGMLVAWVVIYGLWMLHFIGGGDAKFLMALYALFPSLEFSLVLALILLVLTVPLAVVEFFKLGPANALRGMRDRLVTGQILPTDADLKTRGKRYVWTYALPALLFMWVYW